MSDFIDAYDKRDGSPHRIPKQWLDIFPHFSKTRPVKADDSKAGDSGDKPDTKK